MRDHFKAVYFQVFQGFQMGAEGLPLHPLDVEHQDVQAAAGRHLGVQLPQGAGGGVAGVGEEGLPPPLPLLIEGVEHLLGHEHLPPHDQPGGGVRDDHGDRPDGAQVLGDVLPHPAVPPGGPPDEDAVLILQRHREAVHLWLHHIAGVRRRAPHPLVKLAQLLKVEYVLEGLQGHPMDHLLEGVQGLPPTRWVGESGVIHSGWAASSSSSRRSLWS